MLDRDRPEFVQERESVPAGAFVKSPPWWRLFLVLVAACLAFDFILATSRALGPGGLSDLRVYRTTGRLILEHPEECYSHEHFYPPTTLPLFWLLVHIPDETCRALWLHGSQILYLLCCVLTVWLLHRSLTDGTLLLLIFLFCFSQPAREEMRYGQMNVLILTLMLIHMRYSLRGRDLLAGGVLGICCALKPYPGILGIPLLLNRQWKAIGATLAVIGVFAVLPWFLTGHNFWGDYLAKGTEKTLDIRVIGSPYNQSILSILLRLCRTDNPFSWAPIDVPWLASPVAWVAMIGGLASFSWVAWRGPRGKGGPFTREAVLLWQLMMFLSLMLAISPSAQDHYFIWPLPALAWLLSHPRFSNWSRTRHIVIGVVAAVLVLRLPYTHPFLLRGWWILLGGPRMVAVWVLTLLIAQAGPASTEDSA